MISKYLKIYLILFLILGNQFVVCGCSAEDFDSETIPEQPETPDKDYDLVFGDSEGLNLNEKSQELLKKLWPTSVDDYSFNYGKHNADLILSAFKLLNSGDDILFPEGVFDVETVLMPKNMNFNHISGSGLEKTVLRKSGFEWDNNVRGSCPLRTEIFMVENLGHLTFSDMTLDGNCHHIAVCGNGKFDNAGNIVSGSPQFPTFTSKDGYSVSTCSVLQANYCNNLVLEDMAFKNGYRWCVMIGKVMNFTMQHCIIDTGNISTEFKGHTDYDTDVMHVHTSQDGIHMVNVHNAVLKNNDIHSEDSAIAIEVNPLWTNGSPLTSENITISNNYISTKSPSEGDKLMNDDDKIFGRGLADKWVGQSAVDIFYNEWFDVDGNEHFIGNTANIKNITITENCFENVRYGVRCGFFIGAGSANAEHSNHRIYDVKVTNHSSNFLAGRNSDKPAGMKNIEKNTYAESWNKTGGCGIAIRHSDEVSISNNEVTDVIGGLGINIEDVSSFNIVDNKIRNIKGDNLGGDTYADWQGGEGIRIDNHRWTSGQYDAITFEVIGNRIGNVETNEITIINTKNGICKLSENFDFNNMPLNEKEDALKMDNCSDIVIK